MATVHSLSSFPLDFVEETLDNGVPFVRALEVTGVAGSGDDVDLGAGDEGGSLVNHLWGRYCVVFSDDVENGHAEAAEKLVRRAAIARRWGAQQSARSRGIECVDLAIEKGECRLAVLEFWCEGVIAEVGPVAGLSEPRLHFADAVVGGAGGGAAKDEGCDALRCKAGEASDGAAAHRLGDDMCSVDVEVSKKGEEIGTERGASDGSLPAGETPSAGVVHGHAVVSGEVGCLLPPGEVVATGTVNEHYVRAPAILAVVEAGAVDLCVWHRVASLLSGAPSPEWRECVGCRGGEEVFDDMRIGIGIGITGGETLGDVIRHIQRAEENGFDSVWLPNIFGLDAITTVALAGRETSRIELGTFVVPTYPRHPVAMAQQALTASAAAGGRFCLGIGLSHRVVIEGMFGLDYSKPLRHMREYLSVLVPLVEGRAVQFRGEEFGVQTQLTVPGAPRPQVVVAALGPRMLKLAGRLADGTATWMGGLAYLRDMAIPGIRAAAEAAGRPAPRVVSGFPVAVTAEKERARESAAKIFAVYGTLPSYRAVLDVEGAAGPADVAILGSEEEVTAQLRALAAAGVTDFNASPFPVEGDPGAIGRTIEFLAGLRRAGEVQA